MKKYYYLIPCFFIPIFLFIIIKRPDDATLKTYENSRYGFALDYPSDWRLGQAPENNDGREIISPDGQITCRAYGFANALTNDQGDPQTLDEFVDWLYENPQGKMSQTPTTMAGQQAIQILSQDEDGPYRLSTFILNHETGYGIYCLYPDLDTKDKNEYYYQIMQMSFSLESTESYITGQNNCANLLSGAITPFKDYQTFLDTYYTEVTLTSREYWDQDKLPQKVKNYESQAYTCYPMPFEMSDENSDSNIQAEPEVASVQWDCELPYSYYYYLSKDNTTKKTELENQNYTCQKETCINSDHQDDFVWLCTK